ncbi:MAG: hypothetical protein DRQ99_19440 [Candidatus Parabeggiatoa sp. nov. 3]|jgi:hypothetical protein|nr:MAG: hypothetical protein DRQ99_19440 [Gammaproteobacteria bacterium]
MQWHIITGSKGGIGKTLLTLLLLEYHLERKPDEGVLVLDLNATNTDTSAMLLYNKRQFSRPTLIGGLKSGERMILQQTYSLNEEDDFCYFGVGWPANPFTLFVREQFVDLLSSIKENAREIENRLEIPNLQHVIIDTNYHFCNLFSKEDKQYTKYIDSGLTEDTFTIWFLWVYKQLAKLLLQVDDENEIMRYTAGTIERVFNKKGIGSIIHTYMPVGLLSMPSNQNHFWSRWFGIADNIRRDQDYTIAKLLALEKLPVGQYIEFKKWIQQLQQAHTEVKRKNRSQSEDPHLLFANVLDKAIQRILNNEDEPLLPINIFPLSVYQSALEGYTDKEREDAVAALRKITIYKNFSKLLDRKYESFLL